MEELIDVRELMQTLVRDNISPEMLVGCAIRNLYSLDNQFIQNGMLVHANNVRSTLAYIKLLYDFGQQMNLSRTYLLHKIKLLEVCEQDLNSEISILRGISPIIGDIAIKSDLYESMASQRRVEDQESKSDPELEIILDTRMIGEIDQTSAALQDIGQQLEEKKNILRDIEKRMDDVSSTVLTESMARESFNIEEEYTDTHCSLRVERTPEYQSSNRPRAGSARISLPIYAEMEMSNEYDKVLPPQGALGSPRGQQSGEPDAAGSTSDEGTAGAASASAPVDQATTAERHPSEIVECVLENVPDVTQEEISTQATSGKRRASSSPLNEGDSIDGTPSRRPIKARVITSTESPEDYFNKKHVDDNDSNSSLEFDVGEESEQETDVQLDTQRATRTANRKTKEVADFSQLIESRNKKLTKGKISRSNLPQNQDGEEMSDKSLRDSKEKYFDELVKRVRKASNSDKSDVDWSNSEATRKTDSLRTTRRSKKKTKETSHTYSEYSFNSEEIDSSRTEKKYKEKIQVNKSYNDKNTAKQSRRKKTIVPIIVTKEEAEKEMQLTREDWLKMDPAALGERCLAHLSELEQQRSRCSNISGRVAGRMKESRYIAAEIIKAMIEKLTTVGDIFSLRNENFFLKEEVNELRRKEEAKNKEIDNLRKAMFNLEREVKSLKDGFGPV